MEPVPGGVPTIAGRTPIACQNCANAKTGCDKQVPCHRCAEKNLSCAPRFARRSSKAAVRAAQASAALSNRTFPGVPTLQVPLPPVPPTIMELDHAGMAISTSSSTTPSREALASSEPIALQPSPQQNANPEQIHFGSASLSRVLMDDFPALGNDFIAAGQNYSDMIMWNEYSLLGIGDDLYTPPVPEFRNEMEMRNFSGFRSDISSASEQLATCSSGSSVHTRGTSIMSTAELEPMKLNMDTRMCASGGTAIPEFEVVIAAEDSWPLARCNPRTFSGSCPRTAIVHLEALEQKCKLEGTWTSLNKYLGKCDAGNSPQPIVVPITSRSRDKMTAITQSFLHKALAVHRSSTGAYARSACSPPGSAFNFMLLPPNNVLEYFLGSYVRSLADYYPLAFAMRVDPNEMLQNTEASTLLVLLMIAHGAASVPVEEARYLSAGLTETSRISLFDIIEKDVELSADPIALRCALLFTHLGAWSGDKWLMDIAMGQRGMYLSVSWIYFRLIPSYVFLLTPEKMLRHAGMLEPQPSMIPTFNDSTSTELRWIAWTQRESQNR